MAGNLNVNPLFADANGADNIFGTEDDDFHLSTGSSAIDAGDNETDTDANTAEVQTLASLDIDRNPRFVDDAGVADTGNGTAPLVDMGAYEFVSDPTQIDARFTGSGGDGDRDDFLVAIQGSDLLITINSVLVYQDAFSDFNSLAIDGSSDDDSLTLDFTNGTPIPVNGITFTANGQTTNGDFMVLEGGTGLSSIHHQFTNATDGAVDIDGSLITYTGLEPITDNLSATDRVFSFGGTADDITLTDDGDLGNNISRIESVASSETVDFINSTNSLSINAGAGNDSLTLSTLDAGIPAIVAMDGENDEDTLSGANEVNSWNLTGSNSGTLNGLGFSNFEIILGGTMDDAFTLGTGAFLDGSLDGNEGADSLDYSGFGTNDLVVTSSDVNGFSGTEATSLGSGYSGIESAVGTHVIVTGTGANIDVDGAVSGTNIIGGPLNGSRKLILYDNANVTVGGDGIASGTPSVEVQGGASSTIATDTGDPSPFAMDQVTINDSGLLSLVGATSYSLGSLTMGTGSLLDRSLDIGYFSFLNFHAATSSLIILSQPGYNALRLLISMQTFRKRSVFWGVD